MLEAQASSAGRGFSLHARHETLSRTHTILQLAVWASSVGPLHLEHRSR